MTVAVDVSRDEYRDAFRWALLRLLDYEIGRPRETPPPVILDIIERDAVAQVQGR